jgi:hypothetical protein
MTILRTGLDILNLEGNAYREDDDQQILRSTALDFVAWYKPANRSESMFEFSYCDLYWMVR